MESRSARRTLIALMVSFLAAILVSERAAGETQPIAFKNVVIIDGKGGEPIEGGVVVVDQGIIVAVGEAGEVKVSPEARVIDGEGKSVMPGLADMHIHLAGGYTGYTMDLLGYQRRLDALLYAGVTTVLDTGCVQSFILQLRQEVAAGRIRGPRIYSLGPLLDSSDPIWPHIAFPVASTEQIPKLVRRLGDAGLDGLKVYLGLDLAKVKALVREGEKEQLPVVVDQWSRNGSIDLVRAGIHSFAHMPFRNMTESTIEEMKKKKTRILTTLTIYEALARTRLKNLDFIDHPLVKDTTPPRVLDDLRQEAAREPTDYDRMVREGYGRIEDGLRNTKILFDAGILLTAGTDASFTGLYAGEGIHRELELLVEAGLTPLQAITLATGNAAAFMGAEGEWGTLALGHLADLILVNGRPDRNISDTRKIELVMQAGRILDRETLKLDPEKDRDLRPYKLVFGGE
ncbi:MAG: amidohydrolase family protein [Planctomycetota bacterium]|jgi:imidazolonepropionase-like amidohydrolase